MENPNVPPQTRTSELFYANCLDVAIGLDAMARGIEGNEISTPKPLSIQKSSSSSQSNPVKNQKTLLGFFQKKGGLPPSPTSNVHGLSNDSLESMPTPTGKKLSRDHKPVSTASFTPAPSSDAVEILSSQSSVTGLPPEGRNKENGLPSPITPANGGATNGLLKEELKEVGLSSPSRKVRS